MNVHFRQTRIQAVRLTPLKASHDAPDPEVPPLFVSGLKGMHLVTAYVPEELGGGTNYRLYCALPEGGPDSIAGRLMMKLDLTPWWAHHPGHELIVWSLSLDGSGIWTRLTVGPMKIARPGLPLIHEGEDIVPRALLISGVTPLDHTRVLRVDERGPYEDCGPHERCPEGPCDCDSRDPDHAREDGVR